MFSVQSNQTLPSQEQYQLHINDLTSFKGNSKRQYPKRVIFSQVLENCGFSRELTDEKLDKSGGNGTVSYTADGKYVIRRGCDDKAQCPEQNEITALSNTVQLIQSINPKGFEMNLPIKLFQIVDKDTGKYANCNIQISHKVETTSKLHSMGDVIREIVVDGDFDKLSFVYAVGKSLSKFHQTNGLKRSGRFHVGLQHGDFNAGNILINRNLKNGKISFTLIDNADFREKGRLISDLVYFVYHNSLVVPHFAPDQTDRVNRMDRFIQELYRGYIKKAHPDICVTMKKHIFDKDVILISASENGAYNKPFVNTATWSKTFEPVQKRAFEMAYSARFLNPDKELQFKVNSNDSIDEEVQDIIDKRGLTFEATSLDFSGCTHLKRIDNLALFSKLESLNLSNTNVEAIFPLQTLTQLKKLDASNIKVLAAIEPLKRLTALIELNLSNTQVVWVGPLSQLTNLTKLNLSKSKIDDVHSELHLLPALPNLKTLNLEGTQVTDAFVNEKLKDLLSRCTIIKANVIASLPLKNE